MGFALSSGPFQYNRFDVLNEKKADKDYDGDGKVESGKAEYFGSKDKAIKKATGKCGSDCDCKDCSTKKEEYASDVQTLIDEGVDLSDYTWDGLYEEYITEGLPPALLQAIMKKKMGKGKKEVKENREMAYSAGESEGKKSMKSKPAKVTNGKAYTMKGKDGKPLFKEDATITKEDVIAHLIENNYVNNEVSAEVMFNHITDEFLEEIEANMSEGFMPLPKEKMSRQANKAYGKEQQAVKSGDAAGANKQMQRRIAMQDPSGRKTGLLNKNANK